MDTRTLHETMRKRISQIIFEQMMKEAGKYTVIPIGYDTTVPDLTPYKRHAYVKKILDNLKAAPDFVLISADKTDVIVVEVLYMEHLDTEQLADKVHTIVRRWDPSYVFLVTQQGFYFDNCTQIRAENGLIKSLSESWIRMDLQHKYLDLVHDYVR